jgi:lipid II:glycine glycyltransferase (peptidoglycan interpeptide bridge formation enzyme)
MTVPAGGIAQAAVRSVSAAAPPGWDERTVSVPGGQVMQGSICAEYRRGLGQEPMFVDLDDGGAALLIWRAQRPLGTFVTCRKGPVAAGVDSKSVAARAGALSHLVRERGGSLLYVDPDLERNPDFERAMAALGFELTAPAEPSIHLMRLEFAPGSTADDLLRSFSKQTRQRIRAAESAGVSVRVDERGERLPAFAELLAQRSDELGVALRPEFGSLGFSGRLIDAGQARLYLAERETDLLGGLLVYLQGGTLSTIYSADRAEQRRSFPGVMHLLRWHAIHDAHAMGASWIDLGGVDLPGHRGEPRPGEPSYGLYEHKRSFGAVWVEREQARRIVLRPWVERAAGMSRTLRSLGRGRGAA